MKKKTANSGKLVKSKRAWNTWMPEKKETKYKNSYISICSTYNKYTKV